MDKKIIYTIGYAGLPIDEFVELLKLHNITCLIDVRSVPQSSYYRQFDKNQLELVLSENGILYRNYASEFGARQPNREYYPCGYLDFELFAASNQFKQGLQYIFNAINRKQRICLMCAEKDPFDCHRCILVGRELRDEGYAVVHLVGHQEVMTQEQIDKRLLDRYFPKRNQLSLFEDDNLADEDLLKKAYRKRNEDIGYKIEES